MKTIILAVMLLLGVNVFAQNDLVNILTKSGDTIAKNISASKIKETLLKIKNPEPKYYVEKWIDGELWQCVWTNEPRTFKL